VILASVRPLFPRSHKALTTPPGPPTRVQLIDTNWFYDYNLTELIRKGYACTIAHVLTLTGNYISEHDYNYWYIYHMQTLARIAAYVDRYLPRYGNFSLPLLQRLYTIVLQCFVCLAGFTSAYGITNKRSETTSLRSCVVDTVAACTVNKIAKWHYSWGGMLGITKCLN